MFRLNLCSFVENAHKNIVKLRQFSKEGADILFFKGKGKGHPRTCHEDPEGEQMYCYILSLTSALDGVDGQRHAPTVLLP